MAEKTLKVAACRGAWHQAFDAAVDARIHQDAGIECNTVIAYDSGHGAPRQPGVERALRKARWASQRAAEVATWGEAL